METFEVREWWTTDDGKRTWGEIKPLEHQAASREEMIANCREIIQKYGKSSGNDPFIREIRLNAKGSLQGHYISERGAE